MTEKTKIKHEDPLMGLKCKQHIRRMIIETLEDYPSLSEQLSEYADRGGKFIKIGHTHDKLKPFLDMRDDGVIILYINT